MDLSEDQKEFLRANAAKITSLIDLTRQCFEDDKLDGRSKEGRAVRKFLVENSINFKTTATSRTEDIELTQQQKDFILEQAESGLSSLEIAKIIFPEKNVKSLSNEQRTVLAFIREVNPDIMPSQDGAALTSYISPKSPSRIIKKINDATGLNLDDAKLNRQKQICIERLGINLNNSRFLKIINNYLNYEDRNLFEHEFIRLTWDKPDLTADEINLYLNVCKEVINLEVVSSHLNKLNDMFDIADDQTEMSVRLAEIIKAKSGEYHQCESRIENLTKKLQGDRAERMKKNQKENASFLSIVQLFQEEEERKTMVRIAEMQKEAIKKEAERLEGMAEWKARVLGISQEDVI
jgi:hypothetical protein|tara:strand:- start:276 stop:1325 length:1050 start_codon:yes stop_codon:yes gene_type:complete